MVGFIHMSTLIHLKVSFFETLELVPINSWTLCYDLTSELMISLNLLVISFTSKLCSSIVTLLSVLWSSVDNEEYWEERFNIWLEANCWFRDTIVCNDCTLCFATLTSCVRAVSFVDMVEYWFLSVDVRRSFVTVPWIALFLVWGSCKSLVSVTSLRWFSKPREVREWLTNNKYCSMDAMRFNAGCSPKTVAFRNSSFLIKSTSTCSWPVTDVVRTWIEFAMLFIIKARSVVFAMLNKRWY